MTREDIKTIIDIVHETIYGFFDICDEEETPMTDKDKLLLKINKAICTNIKALEHKSNRDMEEIREIINCDADAEIKLKMISNILTAKPHYFEKKEPCGDVISRQAVIDAIRRISLGQTDAVKVSMMTEDYVKKLPPVNPQEPKTGHCKDCKYFEYDSVVKADGIPLIVAHEICSKWGDGCKTSEDGYCFLFESQESEET